MGSATNQDGRTSSITTPSSLSQQAVIKQALVNSRIEANQISYLETHGTGTSLGDAIELEALSQVFNNNQELVLGAVKTNIGHAEAAAGIASLIKAVLTLENNIIPANLHLKEPNKKIEWQNLPFILPKKALALKDKQPYIAGVSSFGFSGTNAHLIVQQYEETKEDETLERLEDKDSHLFTISARTKKALDELATKYIDYIASHADVLIEDVCFTANIGRSHLSHRLAVCTTSITDLNTKLTQYIAGDNPSKQWHGKVNSNREPKLALIFERDNQDLKELIESIINSSLVSSDFADICWQISEKKTLNIEQQQNIIYSLINSELDNWQILIYGLAQLYILGVDINWNNLDRDKSATKISLPSYPFQRHVYWID
ncbi:MAG: ketoacyl-synthetase C-terminal extension domain-containing protein [Pleurocapsa sp.]